MIAGISCFPIWHLWTPLVCQTVLKPQRVTVIWDRTKTGMRDKRMWEMMSPLRGPYDGGTIVSPTPPCHRHHHVTDTPTVSMPRCTSWTSPAAWVCSRPEVYPPARGSHQSWVRYIPSTKRLGFTYTGLWFPVYYVVYIFFKYKYIQSSSSIIQL